MKNEMQKRRSLFRRVLSVLMIAMLVVSIVAPNIVWADETSTTTNGYYDANGEWHQGGDGVLEYRDGDLILSKTAKPVEGKDNIFEIELSVGIKLDADTFNPNSIATVLVIDTSASMRACEECESSTSHYTTCSKSKGYGNTAVAEADNRLSAAKQAAIAFIDEMRKDAPEGVGRYVNLVTFYTNVKNMLDDWQDVTTDEGYAAVKTAIENLKCSTGSSGGTNLDGGIGNATELINSAEVSAISKTGKSVVILTDGRPTYYVNTSGHLTGNGSDTTKTMLDDTTAAADTLKGIANVFTVCYSAADSGTYTGGPTVGKYLEEKIATPATSDVTYAYTADSAIELINSFMSIVDITLDKAEVVITDPMPENIIIPEGGMPEGVSYVDGKWSFDDIVPTEERNGDYVIYTYKITYLVEIDPYADGIEPGKFYPANKPTQIVMDNGEVYDFPVPGIMPIAQTFDVTYNSGDHGSLEGEDSDGNVIFEDAIKGSATPEAPEVTPDDGWYFVGWTPEVSKTVEGEVIYTAQYSPKQTIVVTGNSDAKIYNGTEQSVEGFTVTGLPQGWTLSGITHTASGTYVSELPYVGSFEGTPVFKDSNGMVVPAEQYTLVLTEGALVIAKREITITADSASKQYDGTPLTSDGVAAEGLEGADTVTSVTVVGSQTTVGQSANVASGAVIMNGNDDVTANYNITYVDGTLTVTKNTNRLIITAVSDSKGYDGVALVNGGYTFTQGILAQGDTLVVDVNCSQRNVGTSVNEITSYKVMRGDKDVTANYTIVTVNGTLEVTKRELTITADSAEKVYDGTALSDNGWKDIAPSGLADGDEVASVTVTGSQTDVGQSANVAANAKVMRGDEDVTANYNITYVDGTLTVSVVGTPITITANSNSKVYDGLALIDGGFTFTQGVLAEGDVLVAMVSGSQTNVGSSANEVVGYKVMRGDEDVTSYYTFAQPVAGTLTVTKIDTPIVILPNSFGKVYDGTALVASGDMYTFTQGVLVNGDVLTAVVEGSQTNVGSSASVVVSYKVMNGADDVTANYNIMCADGILEVFPRDITITADSASKQYDGTPLTSDGIAAEGLAGADTVASVTVVGSQTAVGQSANVASGAVIMNGNDDVTANYNITYVDGTLTVTKNTNTITITADSDSKEYDGTPLTNSGYTFTQGILADGDVLTVVVEGSQTFVGSSANKVVSYKVMRDGVDVTNNYTFDIADGTLTVTKNTNTITITASSDSKEYDGTPLTNGSYTVTGELADGDELVVEIEGSQTFVGQSANKVVTIKVMRGGVDVTDNYANIKIEDGTLTVTTAGDEIIVTAGSASKEYDGTPLTNDSYTVTGELADGDELVVEIEGSQTFVGSSANKVVTIKVMRGGVDVTDNYNIGTPVDGVLEITAKANTITITAASDSKVYDGVALVNGGYTFTQGILVDGDVLTAVVEGSQTNAGVSANKVVSYKVMRAGTDVTDSYTFATPVDGTLTVEKRDLTITADSAEKVYDGTALTDNGWKDTMPEGLASGDTVASVTVSGSQTDVGQSANVASGAVVVNGNTNVTANYNIIYVDGTLTVSVVGTPITITANSNSKVYDGLALIDGGYTFTQGILAEGDVLIVMVSGSQTNVGTSVNEVVYYAVMRGNENITSYYTFAQPVNGALTVEKCTLTITADSATKEYDGTPLTSDTYTADGLAADDNIDGVSVVGSQTLVGTSANVVSGAVVMNNGTDATANYDIIYVDGTLTVTKSSKAITVTASSDSKTYDGTPLTNSGYTFEGELADGDEVIAVIEGSQTVAGTSLNEVVSVKVMHGDVDVTDNYEIDTVNGMLTVNKIAASIVIVAGSDTKPYDGTPLTSDSYTYTDGVLIEGDRMVVVIEGSQTEIGSSANKVVSIRVMRGDVDVTDSYNIEFPIDGELVVTEPIADTGDHSNITIWNVMMFVSLLTLFVLALTSKKQRAR